MKISAIEWYEEATQLADKLNNHNIYVTPTDTFNIKFRDIYWYRNNIFWQGITYMAFWRKYEILVSLDVIFKMNFTKWVWILIEKKKVLREFIQNC